MAILAARTTPEEVVSAVLEPNERLLWAGQPAAHIIIRGFRRRQLVGLWIALPIAAAVTLWATARGGPIDALFRDLLLQPRFLVPATAVALVMLILRYVSYRRVARYARSLSYAMTDRRLVVLEHGKVVDDFPPERLSRLAVRRRAHGYDDVVFGQHARAAGETRGTRDPVLRERNVVAFKALADAEAMVARIEAWLDEHKAGAERAVAAAAEELTAASGTSVRTIARTDTRSTAGESVLRHIVHARLGLRVDFPRSWEVQVRTKSKPRGRFFLDREKWHRPEDAGDWNVVRGNGRMHVSVEVEVFETRPTVTVDSLAGGRLAEAVAGGVVDSAPDVRINGLQGFNVTRRNEIRSDPVTRQATLAATIVRERHTVLYDGRRQIYVVSSWPEDSPELEQAVDSVVRSVRIA